jgi:glycosyltransferase involved in cell wall biosynthesis
VKSIFFITTSEIPSLKANSVQSIAMANGFSNNGFKTYFLSKKNKKKIENLNSNISVYRFNFFSGNIMDFFFSFFLAFYSKIKKTNLIFSRNIYVIFFSIILNIDCILELHKPYVNKKKFSFYFLKFIFTKKKLLRIIYISNALRSIYQNKGFVSNHKKEVVLHDGSDYSFFLKNEVIKKNFSVGYAGSFQKGRGIEIIKKLSFFLPNIDFNIAGVFPENENYYKRYFNKFKNIKYVGFIKNKNINDFLRKNSVLIAPYEKKVFVDRVNDTSEYMSPLKIFEYMNAERPIIASNLPVLREVLVNGKNCLLCDPEKIFSWVNAIKKLQSNFLLCKTLTVNAKISIKNKYNWNLRVKSVMNY